MRILLCYLFCCLVILPGCGRAQKQITQERSLQKKSIAVEKIEAQKQKRVFEFVRIGEKDYPVPTPWRGRRLQAAPLAFPALQQIPIELTHNSSKIYIVQAARDAFVRMAEKAKEEGIILTVHSGYRSMRYQRKIFSQLMEKGRTWQDLVRYVAPPGYSEHMLGTVVDLYPSNWRFAKTTDYQWLKTNAVTFGFTETYPESGADGFHWEPWHWKYTAPGETQDEK